MASGAASGVGGQRMRDWLRRSGCFRFDRESVARGVAIGLLIGLTPTVGFQTVMMLLACLWLRGNFPVAFAMSCISNPVTLPAMIYAYHELGERLFGSWVRLLVDGDSGLDAAWSGLLTTALGSLLVAVVLSLLGYFTALGISEVWNRRRHHARRQRREAVKRNQLE